MNRYTFKLGEAVAIGPGPWCKGRKLPEPDRRGWYSGTVVRKWAAIGDEQLRGQRPIYTCYTVTIHGVPIVFDAQVLSALWRA